MRESNFQDTERKVATVLRTVPPVLARRYEANGWWTKDTIGDQLARGLAQARQTRFVVHSAGVVHSHQTLGFETGQLVGLYPPDRGPQLTAAPVGHFIGMINAARRTPAHQGEMR